MKTIPVGHGQYAIVDDKCYPHLSCWKWNLQRGNRSPGGFYAKRSIRFGTKRMTLFMHHLVIGRLPGVQVDHINGNTLDNQLINLRFVSQSQNILNGRMRRDNRTGYRGVVWRGKKFFAQIRINRHYHSLGTYKTAEEAGQAYEHVRGRAVQTGRCPITGCHAPRPAGE